LIARATQRVSQAVAYSWAALAAALLPADKRDVPYQSLLKFWLAEKLDQG
jgi:hypothetical protein